MLGTQQTIHLGIRLRAAQLHSALYYTHWADTRGLRVCVHTHRRANTLRQACIQRGLPITHLSLQRAFATMARKSNYKCWFAAFVSHKGEIGAIWEWASPFLILFMPYLPCFPSVSQRKSVKETQTAVSSWKKCVQITRVWKWIFFGA